MKEEKINLKEKIFYDRKKQFVKNYDKICLNEYCDESKISKKIYESKKCKHVYYVCLNCGNVQKINMERL